MANKVADLLVQLTLESASFKKELEASRKDVQNLGDSISGSFKTMANVVGVSVSANSATMAVNFVKSIAEGADALGKLSQKIGISVEDLSTLEHALKLSNVPIETFSTGVGLLSKALAGMSDEVEGKGAPAALQALGINARDANGDLRPTIDVLLQIAEKFKGFADGAGKTNLALQLFGRSGKELIPFLNEGADGIKKMQEEARDLGLEIGGDTANSAQKFNDSLVRVQGAVEGASRQFLEGLAPALDVVADQFDKASKAGDGFFKTLGKNAGLGGTGLALGLASTLLAARRASTNDPELKALIDAEQRQLEEDFQKLRAGYGLPTPEKPSDLALIPSHGDTAITPKVQPPRLPDAAAIAAAKKYADELLRADKEVDEIITKAKGELDPFDKIAQDYGATIDKLAALWAKYPEERKKIEGAVLDAVKERDHKILEEDQKTFAKAKEIIKDYVESVGPQLEKVPIIVPKTFPTLNFPGFDQLSLDKLKPDTASTDAEATQRFAAQEAERQKLFFDTRTNAEKLAFEIQKLNILYKDPSSDEYKRALEAVKNEYDDVRKAANQLGDEIFDALEQGALMGRSWSDVLKSIGVDIAKLIIQLTLLKTTAAQGVGGASGHGLGGLLSGLIGGIIGGIGGGALHIAGGSIPGGGNVPAFPGGGISVPNVPFDTNILIPHATGGDVLAGRGYMVGEQGPEPFFPQVSGTMLPHDFLKNRNSNTTNIVNLNVKPTKNDPYGYSDSQLANAAMNGLLRSKGRA